MLNYKVVIKPRAWEDILESAYHICEQSADDDVGSLWLESIQQHIRQLDLFPNSYSRYEVAPYRKIHHGRYLILYRVDDEALQVTVCRIVDGARLPENIGPIEDN